MDDVEPKQEVPRHKSRGVCSGNAGIDYQKSHAHTEEANPELRRYRWIHSAFVEKYPKPREDGAKEDNQDSVYGLPPLSRHGPSTHTEGHKLLLGEEVEGIAGLLESHPEYRVQC